MRQLKTALLSILINLPALFAQSTWKILPNAPDLGKGRYEDLYFVNERIGWAVNESRIIKTTDGGDSWQTQFFENSFRSISFADSLRGWAGTLTGRLFQTNDGGQIWRRIDTLITPAPSGVCDLSAVSSLVVFGSGRWSGPTNFLVSLDGGLSWQNRSLDQFASLLVGCKFLSPTTGFVGGASPNPDEGGVVLYTEDGGASWQTRHKTMRRNEHIWNIIFVTPEVGYATIQNPFQNPTNFDTLAIIKTIDGGQDWQRKGIAKASTSFRYAESIGFLTEQKGWVGSGVGNGLYETDDGGDSWTYINLGSKIHGIYVVNDSVAYAGGRTIYKYSPETTTRIVQEEDALPLSHRLVGNHPNPFNASTKIRYSLSTRSFVWLNVYNLNGRLVEALVRGYQNPGEHAIIWDAGNLPSGVYIYSLRTDEGMYVGKAMLIK